MIEALIRGSIDDAYTLTITLRRYRSRRRRRGLRATLGLPKRPATAASKVVPTRSHTVAGKGGIRAALANRGANDWRGTDETVKGSEGGRQDAIEFMARKRKRRVIDWALRWAVLAHSEEDLPGLRR